ncbi:unnamed protein product [Fraxinus pennsylvanica]|uniref:Uncharacterized protein n=1 Tax=Fraxinus pennsylvanica TaxID=56036 RepID=A0AAD2AFN0_9LAMI|nr:unnamed protein product [Fraxinus pennsylvanica]
MVFVAFLVLLPTAVLGECTCEADEEDRNKSLALKYKLAALASILVVSVIGVCLPVLGKTIPALSPERSFFFIIKAFAAGVILSTGFIHVLPDAFENLTSPCISPHPWGDFPFTGFVAMVSAIGTLMVDTYATSYYSKKSSGKAQIASGDEGGVVPVHTHATHGHAHGAVSMEIDFGETQLLRHRVISQLGIIVHSVIIGIALGASESPKTIRPLIATLTFHQFYEGMGLGGCISQAKFKSREVVIMALFFSLTTPIGIGITKIYSETSPNALIIEGIFNAASAGILIYMALVDLLSADYMSPRMQSNGKLQLGANISLLTRRWMYVSLGQVGLRYITCFCSSSFSLNTTEHIFGECTCEADEEDLNKSLALKYKLAALASIFVASAIGVCFPVLGKTVPALSPERSFFFIIKASESPKTIMPLIAALTFHQFFEGMGLGGCITQAKFKSRAVAIMALFFSLTTPIGIVIGIGLTNIYSEINLNALIVEGIFNAASAGILIYMALVDLLSADFMSPRMQSNGKLQLGANVSLLLGVGSIKGIIVLGLAKAFIMKKKLLSGLKAGMVFPKTGRQTPIALATRIDASAANLYLSAKILLRSSSSASQVHSPKTAVGSSTRKATKTILQTHSREYD